jgi:pentatricopeptide repeat protein
MMPNQIIISTLLKGCVSTSQYDRAWKLFTYLKTEVEQPDTLTYNLMISMCAKTGEAEKALDLFQEMASYKQEVDHVTFTCLIEVSRTKSGLCKQKRLL